MAQRGSVRRVRRERATNDRDVRRSYIVGTRDVDVREGSWRPPLVAVLEFDSVEAAREWYESDEYRELLEIRLTGATTDLVLVDGLE